jgi:hypothetical protein
MGNKACRRLVYTGRPELLLQMLLLLLRLPGLLLLLLGGYDT